MVDILQKIIATKREEVAHDKQVRPLEYLLDKIAEHAYTPRSMRDALAASPSGIIAEFKRRSPSKGWINPDADPAAVAQAYTRGGATAMSVLTDATYFGGSRADFRQARAATELPLLRKEFIFDPYQVYVSASLRADAILLIASVLEPAQCADLAALAHELGMQTLLEVHTAAELDRFSPCIDMLGVNNRHLGSFHTDPAVSLELASSLPTSVLRIAESGLTDADEVRRLRRAGFSGFLMGEHFMRQADPEAALAAFTARVAAE
jgi:indole-3-glycerol phosphate synthase